MSVDPKQSEIYPTKNSDVIELWCITRASGIQIVYHNANYVYLDKNLNSDLVAGFLHAIQETFAHLQPERLMEIVFEKTKIIFYTHDKYSDLSFAIRLPVSSVDSVDYFDLTLTPILDAYFEHYPYHVLKCFDGNLTFFQPLIDEIIQQII